MITFEHRGPPPSAELPPSAETELRQMVDSAYPLSKPPFDPGGAVTIVLIYSGGDTVHPWTPQEVRDMPERYRFPCWVRSNPAGFSGQADAVAFLAWLHAFGCPMGTCVILDLETAVDPAYVKAFNETMRAGGFKVVKYGSQDFIWQNPKTDGGTYVALPGKDVLTTEGDTVARQWGFDGNFDLSIVKGQAALPLWDARPPKPKPGPYRHLTRRGQSLESIALSRGTTVDHLVAVTAGAYTDKDFAELAAVKVGQGMPYYTTNP